MKFQDLFNELWDQLNNWAGGELLSPSPSKEAQWVAEDLFINAGWLYAVGEENLLPEQWRMVMGGSVAQAAIQVVIGNLKEIADDLGKIVREKPTSYANETLEHYLERVLFPEGSQTVFGALVDSTEEEILSKYIDAWAAAVALRQMKPSPPLSVKAYGLVGPQLREADYGGQWLTALMALEQAEAKAAAMFVEPVIRIWMQEEITKIKEGDLKKRWQAVRKARKVDPPSIL